MEEATAARAVGAALAAACCLGERVANKTAVIGRPPLPPGEARDGHIRVRTYQDVAEKVRRNGTEWLERVVRSAAEGVGKRRARPGQAAREAAVTDPAPGDEAGRAP